MFFGLLPEPSASILLPEPSPLVLLLPEPSAFILELVRICSQTEFDELGEFPDPSALIA